MSDRQPRRRHKKPAGRILYMDDWVQADGTTRYCWKAPPRLRKHGWTGLDLGTDEAEAAALAIARNKEVEAWEQGRTTAAVAAGTAARAPRRATFGDLVHDFRQHMAERGALGVEHEEHLAATTLRQYRTQIKWLMTWAEDGKTWLSAIDEAVCTDLRKLLVGGTSDYNAAARLRMLRQLLGHAARLKWIKANPMDAITIPTPAPRTKRAAIEAIEWLADFARTHVVPVEDADTPGVRKGVGGPNMELAILMGFFTTQREGDILDCSRMNWRPIEDVDHYDRDTLSIGGNGALFGLRVRQSKTRKWVTCFLPIHVANRLDALIEARGAGWDGPLLQEDVRYGPERHWPGWDFQRDYRAIKTAAVAKAKADGNEWLADQLADLQFRDMRRSGMCWMRDMGVQVAQIAAISGHSIAYTLKILDTYMPGDARGSAAGLAHALRTRDGRKPQEKKG